MRNYNKKWQVVPKGAKKRSELLFNETVDPEQIDMAISYLKHHKDNREKSAPGHCKDRDNYCWTKRGSNMRAQIPVQHSNYIADEMRKAILMHDWESAARLLNSVIITAGPRQFSALIAKACLVLLVNHPESSPISLKEYIGNITNYEKDEEIDRMAMVLCSIRHCLPPKRGCEEFKKIWIKHMSSKYDGKLVYNREFTKLPLPPRELV